METLMENTRKVIDLIESQIIEFGLAKIVAADRLAKGNYETTSNAGAYAKRKANELTFQDAVYSEVI